MTSPAPQSTPASQPAAALPPEADTRVLIVDDNLQNLELLQAYLEETDCAIALAHDGMEALAEVEKRQPDIILLDVMMPRMSGYQVCAKLKADPATRDIPIVMVTALNEISDVERAIVDSGADDFLTKPVNKLELITRVRSLMRVRLLKKQLDRTLEQVRRLQSRGGGAGAGGSGSGE